MIRTLLAALLAAVAAAAVAQEPAGPGRDAYAYGGSATVDAAGTDDAFAAGERVDFTVPITGSAHAIGRRVSLGAEIGGNAYAAGADVTVGAPVGGDAALAGYDVAVEGRIGGDLRAAARHLRVAAPVAGDALLSGGTVTLDGPVGGDASIDAAAVAFGPDARVAGRLVLSGAAADAVVPAGVAPGERVERHGPAPARPPEGFAERAPGLVALSLAFAIGVVVTAACALVVALVAPARLERSRALAGERPLFTAWIGFLTLSALVGATVLAVLTIVGIVVAPAILVLALIAGFLGYLVAVYLAGRWLWARAGQLPPDTFGERALVALLGALAVSLIALLPFVGWLTGFVLMLLGLGTLSVALFRPEFRR